MNQHPSITVIRGGNGWLVVEKPAGMSIHNDPGNDLVSILDAQLKGAQKLAQVTGYANRESLRPLHRIDLETSGLVLFSTSDAAHKELARQLESGQIKKNYLALVHGDLGTAGTEGVWDTPLTKAASGRRDPQGKGKTVPCETRYQVKETSPHYTLLSCRLITGRKHQIRRHAKLAGHPLTGDTRYGSPRAVSFLSAERNYNRLGLHADSLSFIPPFETARITVSSGGLPETMERLLRTDCQGFTKPGAEKGKI